MDKGIVCLTFDDGRKDNDSLIREYLIANGIPVTLNVTTGYVDGSCPEKLLPTNKEALSIQDIVSLSHSSLVEIAAHGDMHLNTDEDIDRGHAKLVEWLKNEDVVPMGFASPSTQFSLSRLGEDRKWLNEHGFSYIAMGQRRGRWGKAQLLCRKAGRIVHLPKLYEIAYKDTLMEHCNDGVIYRVPIHRDTTFSQIKRLVQKCVKEKKALFLMFHSVDSVADDTWTWERKKFYGLCQFLMEKRDAGSLHLCTAKDAMSLIVK